MAAMRAVSSRRLRLAIVGLAGATIAACRAPERTGLEVRFSSALGCRPDTIETARVEAWGDFPLTEQRVVIGDGTTLSIDGWPRSTEALFVRIEGGGFLGEGVARIPVGTTSQRVLMLPPDVSCPVADESARLSPGAGVLALPDGSVVFVGGLDEAGLATRQVVWVGPGDEVVERGVRELLNPVAWATVTALADREVLVAGGAAELDGSGRDTFERLGLDDAGGTRRVGTLSVGRRDHSALELSDGSVLLVGGQGRTGLLDSLESISPGSETGNLLSPRLAGGRAGATLVERADGSVVIAGGVDESGTSSRIEILSADRTRVTTASPGVLGPPAFVGVIAGPTLVWVQRDGEVRHVLLAGAPLAVDAGYDVPMTSSVAVASNGDLLVRDEGPVRPELVIVHSDRTTERVVSSRGEGLLLASSDGTFVELDAAGMSRVRPETLDAHAPPPSSYQFPLASAEMVLDAPLRLSPGTSSGGVPALRADDAATLYLPVLTFTAMTATVRVEGQGRILFTAAPAVGSAPVAVAGIDIGRDTVGVEACTVTRVASAPIMVSRSGGSVTMDAGAGSVTCALALPARVGLGLALDAGASVSSIAVARIGG